VADQVSTALVVSCHVSGVFSSTVHVSGVFNCSSHFSTAFAVIENAELDVEDDNLTRKLENAVVTCDASSTANTTSVNALALLDDSVCALAATDFLRTTVDVVDNAGLIMLTTSLTRWAFDDVDEAALVVDATFIMRTMSPDVDVATVLVADADRTLVTCISLLAAAIAIDEVSLTRNAADAVVVTLIIVPAPSVTKPSKPKLYDPKALCPYPLRYSAISLA
jgi:hypothetical protein